MYIQAYMVKHSVLELDHMLKKNIYVRKCTMMSPATHGQYTGAGRKEPQHRHAALA